MRVSLIGALVVVLGAAAASPPVSAQPTQRPVTPPGGTVRPRPAPIGGGGAIAPRRNHGELLVFSTPSARIWIDGKDTGLATPISPRASIRLKPGPHKLTFVVGDRRLDYNVTIEAGKTTKIVKQLPVGE